MKKCRNCGELKELNQYGVNNSQPDKTHYICKDCNILKRQIYFKTRGGVITDMYSNQVKSSKERGINPPNYSKVDFTRWVNNQINFEWLFNDWCNSDYNTYEKPSCDRINNLKHYTLDNLKLMTWQENLDKVRLEIGNTIYVYDESWVLLQVFHTTKDCLDEYDTISTHHELTRISNEFELHNGNFFQEYKNDKK